MSNRLTFSLASLTLMIIMGLVAMPAMAAAPTFDGTVPSTITLDVGGTYETLLPTATDPDNGGAITYELVQKTDSGDNADPTLSAIGFEFTAGTRLFRTAPATGAVLPSTSLTGESGTYVYRATTTNLATETGDAEKVEREIAITVNSTISFGGATVAEQKLKTGRNFELRLPMAADPTADTTIGYALTPDIAATISGLAFNDTLRYISGTTPDTAVDETEFTYTATATRGGSAVAAAEIKFKITVALDSDPMFPTGVTTIAVTGKVGEDIERTQLPAATDADGDDITYTLDPNQLPAGLSFSPGLRLIEGRPTAITTNDDGDQAAVTYTWTATDADGPMGDAYAGNTYTFTIDIMPADPTPLALTTTIDDMDLTVGTDPNTVLPAADAGTGVGALTYALYAPAADGTAATTTAVPAAPLAYEGLSFDTSTRTLSGMPTEDAAGTYTYTITDSATPTANMVSDTFEITVNPAPVAVALTTTISDISLTVGDSIAANTVLPEADAGTGVGALTYSLMDSANTAITTTAVNGLMFDASTRTLSGDPSMAASGTYTYTVTDSATPTANMASQTFDITVTSGQMPPEKPDPPAAAIDAANDLTINVSWTAPADNGSAITKYTLKKYEGTTLVKTFPEAGQPDITASPFAVGPVPAADRGKSFTFTVTATNAGGDSAESEMSSAVTIMNLGPAMPAAFNATDGEVEKTTLTWTEVSGSAYEFSSDSGANWEDENADGSPLSSPREVTGLTGATMHTFWLRVKATADTYAGAHAVATATPIVGYNLAPELTASFVSSSSASSVTIVWRFSEPMNKDPLSISRLQVSDFTIVDHDGTLITGATLGPAMMTAIPSTTLAGTMQEQYELTVPLTGIPDARPLVAGTQLQVDVTLDPNGILDNFGNAVEQPLNLVGLLTVTLDRIPPAVLSHTSMPMTNPTGLPPGEYVEFTFTFDEKINTSSFGPDSIDQGSSHNIGSISASHFVLMNVMDNAYSLKVPIVDPGDDTVVVLKVGVNAVEDMHGNALETSYTATHSASENTAPVFIRPHANSWTWCQAEMKAAILLPLARDTEGDELVYSITKVSPAGSALPNAPVSDGLYWITTDTETRELKGKAKVSDAGTYTWTVMDEHGLSDSTTLTIAVTPYAVPGAVTGVMAMKVDGEATAGADVDKVKLTWTDSNPTTYPNATCIPMVTSYTVSMQELSSHSLGRMPVGSPQTFVVTGTGTNPPPKEYTTAKLGHGTYEFTVTATNLGGTSAVSAKAIWDRTMYHWVIVDDPPAASQNLRANQTDMPRDAVTLDWIPPTHNPDAPVDDTEAGLAMKLYGVATTFGGYHLEVTNQTTAVITTYPKDGSLIAGDQRTYRIADLAVGEYTVRAVASNVVGVGALSNSQEFEIDVYNPGPPTTTPNTAPTFADDAKIDNIDATVGVQVPGRFLPTATDADGDDLEYSLDPALPAGLNFDEDTLALTGTPTAAMTETAYTYTADDGEDEAVLRFFITVKSATAGPPPTSTPTTMLPANGFIVYVRDLDNPPHFGTSNPMVAEWAAMPNLYTLFTEGGGGSLQLTVLKADGTNVGARQVVFSEVMWAVDEGKVGQDSYDGNQWIELRNRTANAIPITSISFAVKADGRPALAQSTDLISNVVGGGSAWIRTKGQNGNSGAADGSGKKEFISMYRKRYHNDSAGWNGGEWLAATQVYHPNFRGTPGVGEAQGPVIIAASGVAGGTIFNEIANHPSGSSSHEWIELRKREGELSNLENWVVDMVTGVDQQTRLFKIPKLNDGRYGDILLITKTDPARDDDHPLRGGYNVEKADADQANEGRDKNIRYYVADDWTTDLPDNGEFVLILRHGADKTNHEKVEDLAGYHPNLKVDTANLFTNLWPLRGYAAPNLSNNKIAAGEVDRRVYDDIPGTKTKDGNKIDKVAFRSDNNDWTGIGYKRNADAGDQNGGTPGYPNNAMLSNETQAGADPVIISEIMYATGDRGNIPQWIELRNMSQTAGVNLDGWQVKIVNHDQDNADGDTYPGDLVKSYGISGKIPPGQTFLVVAHSGTDNTNLPSERVKAIRNRRGEVILSQYGFEITVEAKEKDGKRAVADMFSNLGTPAADNRVRGNAQSYVDPAWMLPAGTNMDGDRVSIVRVSIGDDIIDGMEQDAWRSFDMAAQLNAPESTYYGNRNDLSSPGYTVDGVLPVSLSKFRPERLDDGSIRIVWVTESETNNAGFNILRGEAIDGEFKQINKKLIAGQGTTSERTAYTYTDPSAKPNVVYYYQIQDVSLDGQVQTLRTTHLRGNVSAVGKLTTTWGKLKALQ